MMIRLRSSRARAFGLALSVFALPSALGAQRAFEAGAPLPLQAEAEAIVARTGGTWGAMAWSVDRNEPLFAINPNAPLVIASNNKVLTSVWALSVLGSDYRFPTELLITGPIGEDGVLRGDVVLRGSGDPAFGYPAYTSNPMDPLRTMAQQLHARGVRVVEGSVVGDATVFDTIGHGPEWPRDTGDGQAAYAPRVSGLAYQRNLIWINVRAGQGGPPTFDLAPAITEVPVVSQVRAGGNRAWAVRQPGRDTIIVRGAVSGRGPYRYGVGVANPPMMAAGALRQALSEVGIAVRQPTRVGAAPENAVVVHRHLSMPLGYMIDELNRDSDNFFAEHLWRATVARVLGVGSSTGGGAAAGHYFATRVGVPYGQLYQADGSGLSRLNRASPYAMVLSLVHGHRAAWSQIFHESMAVAGSRQGTLRNLFVGTPAANNLHAKTGYIQNVRTLSGYVRARNGELIAFSFLFNGNNTSGARGTQQQLGVLLASYGTAPAQQPAEAPAEPAAPAQPQRRGR